MRIDGSLLHSRDLYLLLSERLCAGVYSGLDSNSGFKNPVTHPPDGRWVFYLFVIPICIQLLEITFEFPKGAGGEVANARVCKTCIRGFDSRPALQVSVERPFFDQKKYRITQGRYAKNSVRGLCRSFALVLLTAISVTLQMATAPTSSRATGRSKSHWPQCQQPLPGHPSPGCGSPG